MNNTQRKYFVKRIDEIKDQLIRQAYKRREFAQAKIKTPGERLKHWWTHASQKDRRQALETFFARYMENLGDGKLGYSACIVPNYPVEIGQESANIFPVGNLIALNYESDIGRLNKVYENCVEGIKKRGAELKDKVVFGTDAEAMCSLIKDYEHLCENVHCEYGDKNDNNQE
jgi:hypothetical protein